MNRTITEHDLIGFIINAVRYYRDVYLDIEWETDYPDDLNITWEQAEQAYNDALVWLVAQQKERQP